MSLKIKLKPGEEMVLNGGIIRNPSKRRVELEIMNFSDVLRGAEMLDASTADTPVKRVCYLIQIALVSRNHRKEALDDIRSKLSDLREVMSKSHGEALDYVMRLVDEGDFYRANRKLQEIVSYEAVLLQMPRPGVFLSSGKPSLEDSEKEPAS